MARKREEDSGGMEAGWISTFADLMNLLLCFFVLLFSMSTVDASKYEALITSFTDSINVFDAGSAAVGESIFVSSGTDQLVSISEYFNEFEKTGTTETGENSDKDGMTDEQIAEKKAIEKIKNDQKEKVNELYEDIKNKAKEKNLTDIVNINTDANFQYVKVSLKGAVLFDTGEADIKKQAEPILSRIAEILARYENNMINIEGHTDNVPISGTQYRYRNNMELSTARATSVFIYFVERTELKGREERIETAGRGEYAPVTDNKSAAGRARNRRIEIKIYPN